MSPEILSLGFWQKVMPHSDVVKREGLIKHSHGIGEVKGPLPRMDGEAYPGLAGGNRSRLPPTGLKGAGEGLVTNTSDSCS